MNDNIQVELCGVTEIYSTYENVIWIYNRSRSNDIPDLLFISEYKKLKWQYM